MHFEMQMQADRYTYLLENDFDKKTQDEHRVLAERELGINRSLRESLIKAG